MKRKRSTKILPRKFDVKLKLPIVSLRDGENSVYNLIYLTRFLQHGSREGLLYEDFRLFNITIQCGHISAVLYNNWIAIRWTFEEKKTHVSWLANYSTNNR